MKDHTHITGVEGTTAKLQQSGLLRHNALFFAGSVAIGALNYLYYPVLGRLLTPVEFGETQALVSLFLQISIFLMVLSMVTVNIVANQPAGEQRDRLVIELEKVAFLISGGLLLLLVVGGRGLQHFFHFGDELPFVMLGFAVVATVPFMFRSAYLRGRRYFGLTSLAGMAGAGAKVVFSAVLVAWGLGTSGAILGIVLAQLLAFIYAARLARKHGFNQSLLRHVLRRPDLRRVLPELRYALLVLVCSLTITGLYSIDIMVIKHFFDAHTAGLYAGVAAVARIVFFLTASIAQVLLPSVRRAATRHNQQVLAKSFVLLVAIGGAALLVFWLLPGFVIEHLMGSDYLSYAYLLPRLSLLVFLISVLNLFITYHMALRRYGIAVIAALDALISVGLLAHSHGTLLAVINSLLYGCLITFVALGLWLWQQRAQFYNNVIQENRL